MLKNANAPINPCLMQQVGEDSYRAKKPTGDAAEYTIPCEGLTKREYLAGLAMQGFCVSMANGKQVSFKDIREMGMCAIECADELLKQLDKEYNVKPL